MNKAVGTKKAVGAKQKVAVAKASGGTAHDPATYRRLALALPHVVESSHMGAPDFRIETGGKLRIFATLAYGASRGLGTLMISSEQQAAFLAEAPDYFEPAPGGWGRMGMMLVKIDAPQDVLAGALSTTYHATLEKMPANSGGAKPASKTKARK